MSVMLQIELSEADAASLLEEASRAGVSVGELLKDWLQQRRAVGPDTLPDSEYEADLIWKIVGLARSGTGDASREHDRYLYDEET
jgi:hypothetical protein